MAGDQNSFWFPGREALSTPSPQPLHHSHSDAPLYCSPTISGSCTGLLPQGATAISSLGALQHGLLSEPQYVLPQNSGDCGSVEWGLSSYSTSALINGFPADSNIGPSPPLADAAGLSAFVEGALQCDSMADPLNSNFGSSSLPADKVGFNPFEEGELPCNSVEGQLNGPPVGSSAAGATNFYPSCYHGTAPFPSSASFSGSSAISGNGAAAAAFCPSPKQEPFYYPSTGPLVENPPAMSGNDPMATSVGMTAAAGPSQAEPSERNGPNISLFWTPEEQRQLNELCRRYLNLLNVQQWAKKLGFDLND